VTCFTTRPCTLLAVEGNEPPLGSLGHVRVTYSTYLPTCLYVYDMPLARKTLAAFVSCVRACVRACVWGRSMRF
jgi:hypothetical protein